MKKQIQLLNREVEYNFIGSRRTKKIWLAIRCDGSFTVTAPARMKVASVEDFIIKKSSWVCKKLDYFKKHAGQILHVDKKDLLLHKTAALKLAEDRLDYFNQFYGFKYKKITIRNQRRRWGSCSREGNLSFNYQIALLPPKLSDYIIVHELCHLGQLNHSEKFWRLVEKTVPDHRAVRAEFRRLHLH